jgi:hypothetical protein
MSTPDHPSRAGLLARLDDEWRHLASSRGAVAALHRWGGVEPDLAGWSDLDRLRAAVHDRGEPARADRLLSALVRLAAVDGHDDRLASRTVLQLLVPGAVRLARSVIPLAGDNSSALGLVFTELAIGIRTYPWQRRPRHVAANLLLDCRQRLTRRHQRNRRETPVGLEVDPHATDTVTEHAEAAVSLRELLAWAHRRGVLDDFEIRLLVANHVQDIPLTRLAIQLGRSRSRLFAARAAAHRRLRLALTDPAGPSSPSGPSGPTGSARRPGASGGPPETALVGLP